ncbi:26S proteasome regulatory subunit N7 [Pancytospora epiphaga]|nr:26S proteasome regulatory subunit N7 [Pancytospora epiphaga]
MDVNFKEPRLELHFMIQEARSNGEIERLRKYLVEKDCVNMYRRIAEDGIIPHCQADIDEMNQRISIRLERLQAAKKEDPENDGYVFDINKQICELYAQIIDMKDFNKGIGEILATEPSLSLQMDIQLCRMRIAIILNDRPNLVDSANEAKKIFENTCDWDRKNRCKVYLGIYNLIRAEFREAAMLFSEGVASFDAPELLDTSHLILYYTFSGLLTFTRSELKARILENSEVSRVQKYMRLPETYFGCDYESYFRSVLAFIEMFECDAIIGPFKEHFCKEMKVKGYGQLLLSYRSMYLDRMADTFNIQEEHLEEDLRNFINDGRLPCVIDKVAGIVKMLETKETTSMELTARKADNVLRNIKKSIH